MAPPAPELSPDLDAAITAALRMHPDCPGAGRLCQELLAQVTHRRIATRTPRSIRFTDAPYPPRRVVGAARVDMLARRIAKIEALLIEGKKPHA